MHDFYAIPSALCQAFTELLTALALPTAVIRWQPSRVAGCARCRLGPLTQAQSASLRKACDLTFD